MRKAVKYNRLNISNLNGSPKKLNQVVEEMESKIN